LTVDIASDTLLPVRGKTQAVKAGNLIIRGATAMAMGCAGMLFFVIHKNNKPLSLTTMTCAVNGPERGTAFREEIDKVCAA
jgi:hypothetical protein